MEYITRDLQHKTKEILDKAVFAPVTIRRGSEFFEIYKVKMSAVEEKNSVATQHFSEPSVIEDNQEWEEVESYRPVSRPTPTTSTRLTLDDLMSSGLIKKGA